MGYSWGGWRVGQSQWGRTLSYRFGRQIGGEKINKAKFVVAQGGRQSTIKHNNKPNKYRRGRGGICDRWGAQGELYLIVLGAIKFG